MNRNLAAPAAACILATALYLLPIPQRGLVGPDEPRYASIARDMAESGDWVTPHLWGEPWFEKPAMLFWLGGLGHTAGLASYVRVPVALLSLAFLAFFWWRVRESFGSGAALSATCIFGTSAGWVAFSDAGVFDVPVTVFASAALLSLLPWVSDPDSRELRHLVPFGVFLALGTLSKGLVAPIVALFALIPALCERPRRVLDLIGPRALIPFAAVCLPWYLICYWRNGRVFFDDFIVRHHLDRFVSTSLEHVQPWWFYAPVLLAFLLPWTPLLFGLDRGALWSEPRLRFLTAWSFGLILFFSLSVNKLPAYILPAIPPLAILFAVAWQRAARKRLLVGAASTLALVPLAGALLPEGLAHGVTRAWADLEPSSLGAGILAGAALASLAALAALKPGGTWAVPSVAAVAALALLILKLQSYPSASRVAGTKEFYLGQRFQLEEACIGEVRRHVAYGLRHYSEGSIPDCDSVPRPRRVEGDPPRIVGNRIDREDAPAQP